MPKKEREYKKNINVRISLQQYNKWKKYAKNNRFANISHLVRYATDGLTEGTVQIQKSNKRSEELENRINVLENNNKELLKTQREILQLIAKKSPESQNMKLRDYQKTIILNLLENNPMDERDLSKTLNIPEVEVLNIINEFLELGIIDNDEKDKTKYKVNK